MLGNHHRRKGNAVLEFTLVGIPVMFLLISIFEMSRGMWLYHTLAYAMKEGTRFAIVHGNNCNVAPNNCTVTIRQVAQRIEFASVGLIPTDLQNVLFTSITGEAGGVDLVDRQVTCPTLKDCLDPGSLGDTYWPGNAPGGGDAPGGNQLSRIEISAVYPFQSAITMFWPGAGRGINFPTFWLPASSRERIQY